MTKYTEPTLEIVSVESSDIVTASSYKCEIENDGEGKGSVIFSASSLFD